MIDRYEKVIRDNNPEEIKKLLQEYYAAMKEIQEIDNQEHPWNEFWMDKRTPIGQFLSMYVNQVVEDSI